LDAAPDEPPPDDPPEAPDDPPEEPVDVLEDEDELEVSAFGAAASGFVLLEEEAEDSDLLSLFFVDE
jgi:hypothetical protein